MKYLVLFLIITSYCFGQFENAPLYQPFNLNFENATVGSLPAKWSLPDESTVEGYEAFATDTMPYNGKYCLKIQYHQDSIAKQGIHGSAVQSIDAEPYIGKKIRLSAFIRTKLQDSSYAGFYVSERNMNNEYPFIFANQENPIRSKDWVKSSIEFTVSEDAYSINYGMILFGSGKAWIDDISIEILDEVSELEGPKALENSTVENLLLFAKCYGATKFFHPSDEVEDLHTETFLYNSIRKLEKVRSKEEAIRSINNLLHSIAPTVELRKGKEFEDNTKRPSNALERTSIAKITNNVYFRNGNLNSGTKRLNIYTSRMPREAATYQIISAKNIRGETLNYTAMAKVVPYGLDAQAELWFRIDFEDPSKNPINKKLDKIIDSKNWESYSLNIDIPKDAQQIRVGLVFIGEGTAYFDNVTLSTVGKKNPQKFSPRNNSFDMKWNLNEIEYWKIPYSTITSGYSYVIDTSEASYDGSSLKIFTDESKYIYLPNENEVCELEVDQDLYLHLPLSLYDDGNATMPVLIDYSQELVTMNPNDRVTKIGVFIEMWNYLNYYSSNNMEIDWDKVFIENLSDISRTKSVDEFISVMNNILKLTNNIRSDFWQTHKSEDFTLPVIVDFDGDDAKIVKSYDKNIQKNDVIISINDFEISDYITNKTDSLPGKSKHWRQKRAILPLFAGEFKSQVELRLKRGDEVIETTVLRNLTNREVFIDRPYTVDWLDSNIIYLDGTRLNDFELSELMKKFPPMKGVVIDLRGDALLSEHFLGFFTDSSFSSYDWQLRAYTNPCEKPQYRTIEGEVLAKTSIFPKNVVFVTNETSVGKSETILRLVKKYNIGKIVGETTAGSYDTMQQIHLPAFYNFTFDIYPMSFDGNKSIKYKPISPDIMISGKGDYPNDPKIKKAIDLLRNNY